MRWAWPWAWRRRRRRRRVGADLNVAAAGDRLRSVDGGHGDRERRDVRAVVVQDDDVVRSDVGDRLGGGPVVGQAGVRGSVVVGLRERKRVRRRSDDQRAAGVERVDRDGPGERGARDQMRRGDRDGRDDAVELRLEVGIRACRDNEGKGVRRQLVPARVEQVELVDDRARRGGDRHGARLAGGRNGTVSAGARRQRHGGGVHRHLGRRRRLAVDRLDRDDDGRGVRGHEARRTVRGIAVARDRQRQRPGGTAERRIRGRGHRRRGSAASPAACRDAARDQEEDGAERYGTRIHRDDAFVVSGECAKTASGMQARTLDKKITPELNKPMCKIARSKRSTLLRTVGHGKESAPRSAAYLVIFGGRTSRPQTRIAAGHAIGPDRHSPRRAPCAVGPH